jgi:uncharacterized protein
MTGELRRKLEALDAVLDRLDRLVVAFSGGVDSSFLADVATSRLGTDRATCATAVSPSLAPEELADCARLARERGLRWVPVASHELDRAGYVANGLDRCAHCKTELMSVLRRIAGGTATVALGVVVDDLADHRPGQAAAAARGAVFPLVEAGLTKADVREAARARGLRVADKPAAPCLASRLPYGTPVTAERLRRVARAEGALRTLGLAPLRVRDHGDVARIEVGPDQFGTVLGAAAEVVAALRALGYRHVSLDLEGFRSGSLLEGTPAAPGDSAGARRGLGRAPCGGGAVP